MRAVDADIYYQRCSAMLTAVVAEFCRRYGKRSIFASAADLDFVPGRQPIRYLRDRWLFEQGYPNEPTDYHAAGCYAGGPLDLSPATPPWP